MKKTIFALAAITLGGALAINGHGTAVPAPGEKVQPGHSFGSVSNNVLSLTALMPRWGAVGAAVSSSLGYIVAIAVAYGVFLRHAGLPVRALWQPSLTRLP